jgi:signal transduction histidine kinase/plastocyanin
MQAHNPRMRERFGRVLPWLLGVLGALGFITLSNELLPVILLLILPAGLLAKRLSANRRPQSRERAAQWVNRSFLGFFSLYLALALAFLLAGLAPALARAIPSFHDALHRAAGGVEERVQIVARNNTFDTEQLTLPSGDVEILFTNLDVGVDHNVGVFSGKAAERDVVFRGEVITGTDSATYRFRAPPPGTYLLWCDVHPFMNGKVVVTGASGGSGGRYPSGLAGLAGRIAAASHGSPFAVARTGHLVVPAGEVAANYMFSAIILVLAIVLVRARSRDRTARLLSLGMVGTAAVFNAQAHVAFDVIPSALLSSAHDTFHVVSGVAFMFGLLLFPDGQMVPRIAGTAWRPWIRWVARLALAFVAVIVGLMFVSDFHGASPGGYIAFFGVAIPVAGVISQSFRYRHADTEQGRQQSRLLVWALAVPLLATLLVGGLIAGAHVLEGTPQGAADFSRTVFLVFPVLFTIIPLTLVVVLVRYRLWDVERVVSKTLVYGILAAFISTVYILIVVGVGSAVGTGGHQNLPLSILATAIVALAFEPLRRRLEGLANVLVYGRRTSPYEALAEFSRGLARSLTVEEVLPKMAQAGARGVGGERSKVQVFLPGGSVRAATWPEGAPNGPYDRTITVYHEGRPVGDLWVAKPPGEALSRDEDKLLADFASQAGPALRNVQLTAELQARLDEISAQAAELRASRQRLVAAQDAAARRLERNLHDGAQQQLVAIAVTARLARVIAVRDPVRADELLANLQTAANQALDTIRDLARGIYPPLLADEGLVVALQAHVQKVAVNARIEGGGLHRYPSETEAAVYFCCLEALQNVTKYARASNICVRLEETAGWLCFSVDDDGRGFDPKATERGSGLQNMEDRLAALGGSLTIVSTPGGGTSVTGRMPVGAAARNGWVT